MFFADSNRLIDSVGTGFATGGKPFSTHSN
jgi:hypothetical protein